MENGTFILASIERISIPLKLIELKDEWCTVKLVRFIINHTKKKKKKKKKKRFLIVIYITFCDKYTGYFTNIFFYF